MIYHFVTEQVEIDCMYPAHLGAVEGEEITGIATVRWSAEVGVSSAAWKGVAVNIENVSVQWEIENDNGARVEYRTYTDCDTDTFGAAWDFGDVFPTQVEMQEDGTVRVIF